MGGRAGEHQFVATVAGGLVGAGLSPAGGQVELTLDGAAPVGITVATHGPGDVTALAPAAITRLTPPPGTRAFEPNLFAAVELVHPGPAVDAVAGPHAAVPRPNSNLSDG